MKTQQRRDGFDAHFTDEEAEATERESLVRITEEGYKQPLHVAEGWELVQTPGFQNGFMVLSSFSEDF